MCISRLCKSLLEFSNEIEYISNLEIYDIIINKANVVVQLL